jgi:formate-nitrite transporter family protein
VFPPEVNATLTAIGRDAVRSGFGLTLVHAIFAGWLIALMVWLLPAAEANLVRVIVIVTYVVALGSFAHVIAGSIDVMYLAQVGGISWPGLLGGFLVPTLLGNIIGGSALVAALNFAQVASQRLGEG